MPVGGGDIGLNVWVEDGEVLFYVGQSGCRDKNGALLKHGRVRLSFDPNPLVAGGAFRQELKLRESCIGITGQAGGAPKTTVRVWVEVGRPVIHVEIDADAPVVARAALETWRQQYTYPDRLWHNGRQVAVPENRGFRWEHGDNRFDEKGRFVPGGVQDPSKARHGEEIFLEEALEFIRQLREKLTPVQDFPLAQSGGVAGGARRRVRRRAGVRLELAAKQDKLDANGSGRRSPPASNKIGVSFTSCWKR